LLEFKRQYYCVHQNVNIISTLYLIFKINQWIGTYKNYLKLNYTTYRFAVPDIMYKYGIVLQNYEKNSEMVNESVFSMMHHVITKVENTASLFQPIILKTFLKIFENNDYQYKVRMEYV